MPIFEYECEDCKQILEEFVKSGTNEIICNVCGGRAKKIMSSSCFHIKGVCYSPLNPKKDDYEPKKSEHNNKMLFDMYCEKCDFEDEYILDSDDEELCCPNCGEQLKKKIGSKRFELKFDAKRDVCDWYGNKVMRYEHVKELRRQGHDVKGCDEV